MFKGAFKIHDEVHEGHNCYKTYALSSNNTHLSFSELNSIESTESIEFVVNYF